MSVLREPGLLCKCYQDKVNITGTETKIDKREK